MSSKNDRLNPFRRDPTNPNRKAAREAEKPGLGYIVHWIMNAISSSLVAMLQDINPWSSL
jgi:hypothetical protein